MIQMRISTSRLRGSLAPLLYAWCIYSYAVSIYSQGDFGTNYCKNQGLNYLSGSSEMRPKQRDPGDRRSDNRQQYGSGTRIARPARQFMEFRPDSVNNGAIALLRISIIARKGQIPMNVRG